VGPRSVKELTVHGKIDDSRSTVGGLFGDCQGRALSLVLVRDNKTDRRVGVLGLRMDKL